MGPLRAGTALSWDECAKYREAIKHRAALYFCRQYQAATKGRAVKVTQEAQGHGHHHLVALPTKFVWGDEIEYTVLWTDQSSRQVKLSLDSESILHQLSKPENSLLVGAAFHAEYARWMIEAIPAFPFSDCLDYICSVEANMKARRQAIERQLPPGELVVQMTAFPHMGVDEYTHPAVRTGGEYTCSTMASDEMIHSHARFRAITKNLRQRRGCKLMVSAPILPEPHVDGNDMCVEMDGTVFGCGMCCLQVTFQLSSMQEARFVYDQLAVLAPILMALSASTPFHGGRILNSDVRWTMLSQSADDRNSEERGIQPLKESPFVIRKSRYDSIDCFVALDDDDAPVYNDLSLPFHTATFETLTAAGVDDQLAKHVAHLCIRDPLLVMREACVFDSDEFDAEHWITIQSSVWQTVRLKTPSADAKMGWRVELRSLDLQPSDFENAAFAVFTMLLVKVIVAEQMRLYIPISLVDENMKKAHMKDSIADAIPFAFRKFVGFQSDHSHDQDHSTVMMTPHEIMSGQEPHFSGLVPLIRRYLDRQHVRGPPREEIDKILTFMQNRASGLDATPAHWMRDFVRSHPSYRRDSRVPQPALYDLLQKMHSQQRRH